MRKSALAVTFIALTTALITSATPGVSRQAEWCSKIEGARHCGYYSEAQCELPSAEEWATASAAGTARPPADVLILKLDIVTFAAVPAGARTAMPPAIQGLSGVSSSRLPRGGSGTVIR